MAKCLHANQRQPHPPKTKQEVTSIHGPINLKEHKLGLTTGSHPLIKLETQDQTSRNLKERYLDLIIHPVLNNVIIIEKETKAIPA